MILQSLGDQMTQREYYYKIASELNENNFFEISNKYSLSQSELLGVIELSLSRFDSKTKRKKLERLLHRYQYIKSFPYRKYLLLSDTHYGNVSQNVSYVTMAYEFGMDQGVDMALHLGDVFEGCSGKTYLIRERKLEKIQKSCNEQLEMLVNYPTNIPTAILLGNHDISFFQIGIDVAKKLEQRYHFSVIGYGGAYIKCHYRKIYLEHFIKYVPYISDHFLYDLKLRGHSHCFRYSKNSNSFTIASLSDIHENKNCKEPSFPGFAILTIHNRSMSIEGFSFSDGEPQKCLKLVI